MADARKPPTPGPPPAPGADRGRRVTDFDSGPPSNFAPDDATIVSSGPPTGFHRMPSTAAGRVTASVAAVVTSKTPIQPSFQERAPRARVSVPVRYRYQSFIDFVDAQSINVSRSGMFVVSDSPLPIGTLVQFEFSLADGFVILKGAAEVVRIVSAVGNTPRGMGLRFVDIEEKSRKLIDRIVEVNAEEGRFPTVPLTEVLTAAANPTATTTRGGTGANLPAAPPSGKSASQPSVPVPSPSSTQIAAALKWDRTRLKLVLNPATAGYFVYNPLLNIKMGGFVVPCETDVPLGTIYQVDINDMAGGVIIACKGKVVAKQEKRVGIRLMEPDKAALTKLQAEVGKLAPSKG